MKSPGGPLRFLAMIIGGWTMLRITMLWPVAPPRAPAAQPVARIARVDPSPFLRPLVRPAALVAADSKATNVTAQAPALVRARQPRQPDQARIALALLSMIRLGPAENGFAASDGARVVRPADFPPRPVAQPATASRWSSSFWLVARSGAGLGAGLSTSQIGGSQAGARLAYALGAAGGDARRLAVVGRIAAPLGGRGTEAAIGLEWQPMRLPVRLIAEQRVLLDGAPGGGGQAIGVIGGFGPTTIARDFRLEAYGQAGAIRRRTVIGYVDGAVRINRQVALIGGTGVDLGLGSWGAAQPGAARLDLGPSIGLRVPISAEHIRLSIDWRQRVAGTARPGSGPAFTLGADF